MMRRAGNDGYLGDEHTYINEITSIDYGRMIALKALKTPGFGATEASGSVYSIYYFWPVSEQKTSVRVVTNGFSDSPSGREIHASARKGTINALEFLRIKFADGCSKTKDDAEPT